MFARDAIEVIGVHAEGEIGRVLVSGAPVIPGDTLREKMRYLNEVDNSLIRFCIYEPRGSANMTVNLMLEPTTSDADLAFIPMQPDGAHALSGSNAICVATAALETGKVKMVEPITNLTIETPAGLIKATAQCKDGKCERVAVEMAPSFVERLNFPIAVPGVGALHVDIAFGSCYFALVDADELGLSLVKSQARNLIDLASTIKKAANEQVQIESNPAIEINKIEYVIFTSSKGGKRTNCNIIHPGRIDRSPCGTGSGARLASMFAKDACKVNEVVAFNSLIDSVFECRIVRESSINDIPAIVHEISGRAWIYSHEKYWAAPTDPYPLGYAMPDTWGPDIELDV